MNAQDNLSNADSSNFPFIITVIIKTLTITLLLSSLSIIVYSGHNTGHFIMYSMITKIYYRKTGGHVFTKPVQIEGTTQQFFFSSKLFFIIAHISAARRCECM